jgi:hypothetical protein
MKNEVAEKIVSNLVPIFMNLRFGPKSFRIKKFNLHLWTE